jgi:hypothetical protein
MLLTQGSAILLLTEIAVTEIKGTKTVGINFLEAWIEND